MEEMNVTIAKALLIHQGGIFPPGGALYLGMRHQKSGILRQPADSYGARSALLKWRTALARTVKREYPEAEVLMGTSTAGIAHAAIAADILMDLPMGYVRAGKPRITADRTRSREGSNTGQKVVVVEDLISTGGSVHGGCGGRCEKRAPKCWAVVSIFTYGMKKGLERLSEATGTECKPDGFRHHSRSCRRGQAMCSKEDVKRLIAFRDNPSDESWIGKEQA